MIELYRITPIKCIKMNEINQKTIKEITRFIIIYMVKIHLVILIFVRIKITIVIDISVPIITIL